MKEMWEKTSTVTKVVLMLLAGFGLAAFIAGLFIGDYVLAVFSWPIIIPVIGETSRLEHGDHPALKSGQLIFGVLAYLVVLKVVI